MRGKRMLCLLLVLSLLLGLNTAAAAAEETLWMRTEPGGAYVTVRLPYPEGKDLSWSESRGITVRYADTKEPVALSSNWLWSSWIFATVPAAEAARPLEVFVAEETRFEDCIKVWQGHEYDEAPIGTQELNARGIIRGDGTGNLMPEEVITRAEAFTIICRLLSLASAEDPRFADVGPSAWYYDTAAAAKAAGITNEPTYFRPMDKLSRGEFTVMLHRAMKSVGWIGEGGTAVTETVLADADEIPSWAQEAYLAFGGNLGIFDLQETDEIAGDGGPIYVPRANHTMGATRGEVIEFVYRVLRGLPVYPSETAIRYGFDEAMPVIDGSTSTLPYTHTVYGALFANCDRHPDYPAKHSKSYYSYERLIEGEADILFAATPPTADTVEKAKAAGVALEIVPIAYDAMVFFTNKENSVNALTTEQIKAIYMDNAYENWSELGGTAAELIPYCRNRDSGSQSLMEQFFLEGKDIHPDIRRETTSRSMASVLTDVQDAKSEEPPAYALGYSIYYYFENAGPMLLWPSDSLKLLSVDGVAPSDATIADGTYPLSGYNYAVLRADAAAKSPARQMLAYMLSREGQICVANAGYGPLMSDDELW